MRLRNIFIIILLKFNEIVTNNVNCYKGINGNCFGENKNSIDNELKPYLQNEFDIILEQYGQMDGEINKILNISKSVNNLEERLEKYIQLNKLIFQSNNNNAMQLQNVTDKILYFNKELETLTLDEIYIDKHETLLNISRNELNKRVTDAPSDTNINNFIKNEITSIFFTIVPSDAFTMSSNLSTLCYNVQSDIELLERLLTHPQKENCLKTRCDKLKLLFTEIVGILNNDTLNNKIGSAFGSSKKSNDILLNTVDYMEDEKEYTDAYKLLSKTEMVIEKLSDLSDEISNSTIDALIDSPKTNERLRKLTRDYEHSLIELDNKYSKLFEKSKLDIDKLVKELKKEEAEFDVISKNINDCKGK